MKTGRKFWLFVFSVGIIVGLVATGKVEATILDIGATITGLYAFFVYGNSKEHEHNKK